MTGNPAMKEILSSATVDVVRSVVNKASAAMTVEDWTRAFAFYYKGYSAAITEELEASFANGGFTRGKDIEGDIYTSVNGRSVIKVSIRDKKVLC